MNGNRVFSIVLVIAVLWGTCDAVASAQNSTCCGSWAQVATTGPSARSFSAAAYDKARGKVVLFGGQSGSTVFGDTWEWDGTRWRLVATTGPGPRAGHVLVYDGVRDRVVLFGGFDNTFSLQPDTWEWNGTTWTQVATAGPPIRHDAAAAFDSRRGKVVLFGGQFPYPLGDTWEWDGTTWTQVAATGPAPRTEAAMAYDAARGRVVLFGGQPKDGAFWIADTWEWDGTTWTQVASAGPSARYGHAMAFADSCAQVLLFGGNGPSGEDGDLWAWNGSTWTQQAATGPAPREFPVMTFDSVRSRAVLFGGQGVNITEADTWELSALPAMVTNNHDSGAGSLRDAIAAACDGGTITFAPAVGSSIILLSELPIERSLTVQGPGANVLTISGNHAVRVFSIGRLRPGIDVTLSGLTIADGQVQVASSDVGEGGGIYFGSGTLTIANSTLSGNSVSGGIEGFGGGIFNAFGTLNVTNSMLSGNSANSFGGGGGGSGGGAIFNNGSGTVNVISSVLSGNSVNGVGGLGLGGGIYNNNMGAVNLSNSTLSGNTAMGNVSFGGAIDNGPGTLTVTNSTLFGNAAIGCDFFGCEGFGGGIYVSPGQGTTKIIYSTISGNTAGGYYAFVGGIYSGGGAVSLQNTIVAGNTVKGILTRGPDVFNGFVSLGYNLIGESDGSFGFGVKHDQVGSIASPLDPMVDPIGLRDNGGPTPTLALLPGSPAIDRGSAASDPVTLLPITTDQRGFPRPIDDPGTPNPDPSYGGNLSDIGAFEFLSRGQPAISAVNIMLQQGSVSVSSQIGTVSDRSQGTGGLTVAAAPDSGSGVTVSNITINQGGQVFGDLTASCAATNSTFTLTVSDGIALAASAVLAVTISANTPPTLGNYPAVVGPINPGTSTIIAPSAAPADNGTFSLSGSAPNFGGTFNVNATSGVVLVANAGPPGTYAVTIKATDNCGASSTRGVTLLVNHPPSIVTQNVVQQEGSLSSVPVRIASVNDVEKGALLVRVNLGASATVHGVTLSQITIGPLGAVRANLVAACGASAADFTLTVTDSGGLSASAVLHVAVSKNTPPTLGFYPTAHVRVGGTTTVYPNAPPGDNGVIVSLTAAFSPPFGGGSSVNAQNGAVSVFNAGPVGNYVVTVMARDNCFAASFRRFTLNVSLF